MVLILKFIFIPIFSGLIGWITNKIAVWLLFNPKEPRNILGVKFQGVFPKRQHLIAQRIGDLVADDLLSVDSLKSQVFTDENMNHLNYFILSKVDYYFEYEFPKDHSFFNLFIGNSTKEKIKERLQDKIYESLDNASENFHDYLENKVNIRKIVSRKINALDSSEVNNLMNNILKNELGFIELTGAILGFIIGLIQVSLLEIINLL